MSIKPRQEQVLLAVVEEYIALGTPVGSKRLSELCVFGVAPSTIRSDLAQLEEEGYLAHPHTSAGRVPTDAGYRHYVDLLVREDRRRTRVPEPTTIDRDSARAEIDEALRETAEALSRVTDMLAVVSAPSAASTEIRHVEVLSLQPRLVMVVIISSGGRVAKRIFRFNQPVDEGLTEFARVYLNERLSGVRLGTRLVDSAFSSPDLHEREREFLELLRPAFTVAAGPDADSLHMGGSTRLIETLAAQGVPTQNELVEMLEERYELLELLYEALRQDDVYLRIGRELGAPWLQSCALVAASYGTVSRNLGTVSVIGPTRMNYQRVIAAVRASADTLSELFEEIW